MENHIWLYALLSIAAVSSLSFIGLLTFSLSTANLQRFLPPLVSIAVGVMLGNAFLHMIPEAFEELGNGLTVPLLVIFGIFLFYSVEQALHCRHEHAQPHEIHPVGYMTLTADMLENFIDGVLIGAAYLIDVNAGIAATLAVLLHEIPTELSDYSVLVTAGFNRKRALLANFASSITAFIGVILALTVGSSMTGFAAYIAPVAAGCFIYLAAGGLIPRFLKAAPGYASFVQLLLMGVGVAAMLVLRLAE